MAAYVDPYRLSSPRIFLVRMLAFVILAGFVALILYKQIFRAFMANPGLNGLILGVLLIGILLSFRQVVRLFREIRWFNDHRQAGERIRPVPMPVMLAPMATILGEDSSRSISTGTLKVVLDSIATRLDEGREINRYLTGLLIFLGLLGTFWGLLETVGSIGDVIKSMQSGSGDTSVMFDALKSGLSAPIAGMSISFTSSLFGLAGSLVLGFLDLQAGQAQNRFYNELEDNLAATATDISADTARSGGINAELRAMIERLAAGSDAGTARASTAAMANLAEGVQGLVQHMRSEQQMIRAWVEAQAEQQGEIRKLLYRLNSETLRR
jgi:hypothetical protein